MNRKNNKRKGFTIVELVIVIAVIAILAAVMIPTISGVITRANETARDADAKALYVQFMSVEENLEKTDFYIAVEQGEVTYYYYVDADGLDFEETTDDLGASYTDADNDGIFEKVAANNDQDPGEDDTNSQ